MDGKVLLLGFAAIVGAVVMLQGEAIKLPGIGGGGGLSSSMNLMTRAKPSGDSADPNSYVIRQMGMDRAAGPIAATEHLSAAFTGKTLTQMPSDLPSAVPAVIRKIDPHGTCRFSKPAQGSRVAYIAASESKTDSPIFAYGDGDVRKTTEQFLKDYRGSGSTYLKIYQSSRRMHVYDVAVSETQYPVHLVLQSRYNIIWNLHLAEGANVTGVSIIAGRSAGVSGVTDEVPVEIMPADKLKACGVAVQNYSLVNPVFVSSVKMGIISKEDAEETQSKWHVAMDQYDDWFRPQFGVNPRDIVIGYTHSAVALIGPLPTSKAELVPYSVFADKPLVLSSPDRIAVGTYSDFTALFKEEVLTMAREVTGGDLDILKVQEN